MQFLDALWNLLQKKFKSKFFSQGFNQLSEKEMMQKALMHSIQDVVKRGKNNTDDEYDSP